MGANAEPVTLASLLLERIGAEGQGAAMAALSVSQGTVSRYLSGALVPRDDKVPALAGFLKRSEAEVVQLLHRARRNRANLQLRVDGLEQEVQEMRVDLAEALALLRDGASEAARAHRP